MDGWMERILIMHGLKCSTFDLLDPGPVINYEHQFNDIQEADKAEERFQGLNQQQKYAFQNIVNAMENEDVEQR